MKITEAWFNHYGGVYPLDWDEETCFYFLGDYCSGCSYNGEPFEALINLYNNLYDMLTEECEDIENGQEKTLEWI